MASSSCAISQLPKMRHAKIGLNEWIGLHSTPTGSIDEDGCYADAGFTSLSSASSRTVRM